MKLNWKLIIFDIITIAFLFIVIYYWEGEDRFHKFIDTFFCIWLLVRQIDEHYSFYKKQRRFY
ncbi:MAG: hypothetical protein M3004_00845 [Bacteroidota bacterium]|nr:hypothetical protein [Bacteroidota bacterium]